MNGKMGLWVYCVVENKGELKVDALGIHGISPVYTVAHGDFAMVVSEEPMKKYPLVRDFLIAHQLVNEKVMQKQPVLPVKFCTMAENETQIIEQVLKQKGRIDEFSRTLEEIQGRAEYGLRARWKNLDEIFADLERESEKVKKAKERVLKIASDKRQGALIDIGHVVKEAIEEKNAGMGKTLVAALTPHAVQCKKNNVLGDMNILNAAFLVEEKKQTAFDEAVNALVSSHEAQIQFKYVGPIPPFNFVEIVIRWDGVGERGLGG